VSGVVVAGTTEGELASAPLLDATPKIVWIDVDDGVAAQNPCRPVIEGLLRRDMLKAQRTINSTEPTHSPDDLSA
jgi:hypothetical protein